MDNATERMTAGRGVPKEVHWSSVELPIGWPDKGNRRGWFGFKLAAQTVAKTLFGRQRPVQLAPGLPHEIYLPDYLLVEFHNMPNGYYSKTMAWGYHEFFSRSMWGALEDSCNWLIDHYVGCNTFLDLGCGSGRLAKAALAAGAKEAYGLDPCPYLLRIAAEDAPSAHFVQGVAEDMPFPRSSFDGVGACYLFHELPADIADRALDGVSRVLKPGGLFSIVEPCRLQLSAPTPLHLWKHGVFRGTWFWTLAHLVFEPYVRQWHGRDHRNWLLNHGFEVLSDEMQFPNRHWLARKL